MKKNNLSEQADKILKIASEYGIESNFLFITTFNRYQVQLSMLNDLEKTFKESELTVTKEYVKGRKNLYVNPAIKEYNNTTNSANRTVDTLMKIIVSLRKEEESTQDDDPLLKALNGIE